MCMCMCVGGEDDVKAHAVSEDHTKNMTPNHMTTTQPRLAIIVQITNKETFPGSDHKGSSSVLSGRLSLVLGSLF